MIVRPERPADHPRLRALHLAAFAPSEVEADIVDALRAAGDHVPELCLVAEDGGAITGHVVLSEGHVEDHVALGLGPIAVDPERQNQGIGSAMMREAILRASETRYPLIALLGHPGYYPRFGFRPAHAAFGIDSKYSEAPPEAWMALALPAYEPHIRGRFRYPDAFDPTETVVTP